MLKVSLVLALLAAAAFAESVSDWADVKPDISSTPG